MAGMAVVVPMTDAIAIANAVPGCR
jgi:hypothetical protein